MAQNHKALVTDIINRAHHTAVSVKDVEAAKRFYCEVLGFVVIGDIDHRHDAGLAEVVGLPENAECHWMMLEREGYHIELFKWYAPEGGLGPNRQCDLGYTHVAFQVSNVEEAYRRVIAAGFKTNAPPRSLRGGKAKVIYVQAPETFITELVEYT
jgi:catechol 2,3-dioxygenase-like lactoylglutathione lyase family enzyme